MFPKRLLLLLWASGIVGLVASLALLYEEIWVDELVGSPDVIDDESGALVSGRRRACDVNSLISCSVVLDSEWARVAGAVPVASLGIVFFIIYFHILYRLHSSLLLLSTSLPLSVTVRDTGDTFARLRRASLSAALALSLYLLIGILFVIYLLSAEFLVGSLCPLCTLVHLVIVISCTSAATILRHLLSHFALRARLLWNFEFLWNACIRPHLKFALIVLAVPLVCFNLYAQLTSRSVVSPFLLTPTTTTTTTTDTNEEFKGSSALFNISKSELSSNAIEIYRRWKLAVVASDERRQAATASSVPVAVRRLVRCLAHRHVLFFGSSGCGACKSQKKAFQGYNELPIFIDCAHEKHRMTCEAQRVRAYPTWIRYAADFSSELRRVEGVMKLEELSLFADCE